MKRFKELTMEQLKAIVVADEKLLQKFDNRIQESEMDFLSDKLSCVEDSLSTWCIGPFEQSYFKVKNWERFLDGVEECAESFGASTRLEKKIKQCRGLVGTNLFEYHAEKLSEMWYEDEIQPILDFIEDASFELYNKEIGDLTSDYFDIFIDAYDDFLYDEETKTWYEPHSLAIA